MSITTQPTLTYDDLIRRATEDWAAVTNMAYTGNLTSSKANTIAANAITAAVEDWCFDNKVPYEAVSMAIQATALTQLTSAGWDEWERMQQLDLFEDQDIWAGAAAAEARRELG